MKNLLRTILFITVLLAAVFYLSHFYCHCNTETGLNLVGWPGLRRISSSGFTDLNKDRVYSYCKLMCGSANDLVNLCPFAK